MLTKKIMQERTKRRKKVKRIVELVEFIIVSVFVTVCFYVLTCGLLLL